MKNNKKGFTLIEIIVVVVILAVLLAVAVPSVLNYLDEADGAKFMTTSRSINNEVSLYVNQRIVEDKRKNISFDETIKNLETNFTGASNIINKIITTTVPNGYKILAIDCCFDDVNAVKVQQAYKGWGFDKNLTDHQLSKIVIWYNNGSNGNKFVVTLLNKKMYFYKNISEAVSVQGKDESPFISW